MSTSPIFLDAPAYNISPAWVTPDHTVNVTLDMNDFCSFFGFDVVDPVAGSLNLCFISMILVMGVDLAGIAIHIFYFIKKLRSYVDFQSKAQQEWVPTITFFVKILLLFILGFQWTFTKLAAKDLKIVTPDITIVFRVTSYPTFLIVSDIVHMASWLFSVTIVYFEWNRSLPHYLGSRIFWILGAITSAIRLHGILGIADSPLLSYYNNVDVNIALTALYVMLALIGALGMIPALRTLLEPNEKQAQKAEANPISDDDRPASLKDFFKLALTKGRYTALMYLLLGMASAAGKGGLLQSMNQLDGQLFDAARALNTPGILDIVSQMALRYGMVSVCSGLAVLFAGWGAEKLINGTNGIRNTLFRHLLDQEMAYHDALTSGVIASRFANDAERVKQLLAEAIPQFLENLALVIVGLGFLFNQSASLTLYMLGLVPLVFGANYFQAQKLEDFMEKAMLQTADMSSRIQEVFSKYTTVLTYGKQSFEVHSYSKIIYDMYLLNRRKAWFNAVMVSITGFLSFGTQILAFFLGVELFHTHTFGFFITFCLFAMNVVMGLIELVKITPIVGETIGATGAIIRMLDRRAKSPEAAPVGLLDLNVGDGEIEFKNVSFSYPGSDKVVLNNISFKVAKHSKVALVGDSGAGKSTILQLIARFYDSSSGQVLIDGQDIKHCSVKSIRKNLGMVRQDADLFATTVFENILYGRGDPNHDDDNVGLIEEILAALANGRPMQPTCKRVVDDILYAAEQASAEFVQSKLSLSLGEGGKGLSGGQKQRVTVARALYKNPQILLLDEVTSALDQVSEAVVQKAIDRLVEARTVVVVAHRLHTIQNADKIIVMSGGRIVAEGKHDDLMVSSSKYRTMVTAAKRDEEAKTKDTKTTKALALLKDIYEAVRFDPEMQSLSMKIKELVSATEEQSRKIEKAKKLVEQAGSLKEDSHIEDSLLLHEDIRPPAASAATADLIHTDDESEDEGSAPGSQSLPMSRIEERPAPPPPDSDDDGF